MEADAAGLIESIRSALETGILQPGPPQGCSYLPQQQARTVAFVAEHLPAGVYTALLALNFRRSGTLLYRPACAECRQCRNLRVPVAAFHPNRTQRRCWGRNADLAVTVGEPRPSQEKLALFRRYQQERHDGQMATGWRDFCDFLYSSPILTREVEYRLNGTLLGVGIADHEPQAASLVYCYFDPQAATRSPGVFNVLWMIEYCRRVSLPYLYLGYYIRDSAKMNYKAAYKPCEILDDRGQWRPFQSD